MNDHKYFLTIIDDHSRYVWFILMSTKSETQQQLKDFIALMEKQFDTKTKAIQSDNGAEFIMKQFYASQEIIHQTSCIETPQQNGIVERKHQHLLNVTRALLFQANLPQNFLVFCFISCSITHQLFANSFFKQHISL